MSTSKSVFLSDSRSPGCRHWLCFQAGDLGQDGGGFVLQVRFQRRVVGVGYLAGPVLKVEIAQVFVNGILAFAQVSRASFLRSQKKPSGQIENIIEAGDREHQAEGKPSHRSVSLRAWSRNCSSSAPRTGRKPPAMAGAGRFFQARITSTTRPKPKMSAAKGMIQAARSKPTLVGAARTVGPYFWTKPCSTRLSLSPRVSDAMSS